MATATVVREWPDGESLTISIDVDESYPDSVAEAKAQAANLYADALEITLTPVDSTDEDVV